MENVSKNIVQSILKYQSKSDIVVSFGNDHFVNVDGKNYGPYASKEEALNVKNSLRDSKNKKIVSELYVA